MKYKSRFIYSLIVLAVIFIIGGCWNYTEISNKAILLGLAVDYDKERDMIIQTVEIATPMRRGGETVIESEIVEGRGKNLFDAARNTITITGKKLFWSHAKVVIISEAVAMNEEKLITVLDYLKRDAEPRDDIWLLISREDTAKEILEKTKVDIESIISIYLEGMMKNERSVAKYHGVPLWEFIDKLAADGTSPTLPTVKLEPFMDKMVSVVSGTGVFRGPDLVGWLDSMETKYFLFIIDEIKGGIIVVEENERNKPIKISLEIFKNKTKIEPIYSDGQITMEIGVKTIVNIAEIGGDVDFISEEKRIEVKHAAEKLIEKRIQEVIKKLQKEYKSDIFGFAGMIQRDNPKLWENIKKDWQNVFSNLNTHVNVEIEIRGSAVRSEPIKVGD